MENIDRGQVNTSAAEIYEEFFVPALFQEWTGRVTDQAEIKAGEKVLDVACGTGVLARTVVERVGDSGSVIGLDVNAGMLAVAHRKAPQIKWRQGQAETIPFDDATFDAVVSQFGLMFFADRKVAIREMVRVLKSKGKLAVAVWDTLENTPGYLAMVSLLARLFGDEVANGIRAPYILGDTAELQDLFTDVGLSDVAINTSMGHARFDSIEKWVYTDIKGWVLADVLDDEQVELLINEGKTALSKFVTDGGQVIFKAPAHIISGTKA